jgi:hypothetical protein
MKILLEFALSSLPLPRFRWWPARRLPGLITLAVVGIGLGLALDPAGAQNNLVNDMTLTDVGDNARGHYPTGLGIVTGFGALAGVALLIIGLLKSNTIGNHRGAHPMGGTQASQAGPAWSIVVGMLLIFSMAFVYMEKNSLFGPDVDAVEIKGITQLPQ